MFKATRELIKARQTHTDFVVEVVSVKQIGGGFVNDCFNNACTYLENSKDTRVVSGWLVNKFDTKSNSTAIIQHFWNVDVLSGEYIDTTPLIPSEVEYVIDVDISIYGQEHFDDINNCVGSSLLFKDGKFKTVDLIEGRLVEKNISKLITENLFDAVKIEEFEDTNYFQVISTAREMQTA